MDPTGERFLPNMGLQIALEHWHRYFLVAELVRGRTVVDVASGEGYGSAYLARFADKVVGVDVSREALEHARSRYVRPNLEFLEGSVTALPLADASVDVVISFETLEHVGEAEQQRFLQEVHRVLRKGGQLILSTPDKAVYSTARDYANPYHLHELERTQFTQLLEARFPQVHIAQQRAGYFSLVTSDKPLASYSVTTDDRGEFVSAERPLSYEYLIAVCSLEPGSDVRLPESVTFDASILTSMQDHVTQQLVSAQAVAEERAQEIARLIAERREEKARLDTQLISAQAVAEERAREIARLIAERQEEMARLDTQLISAQAVAEERAREIARLIAERQEEKARLDAQLISAQAVAEERAREIARQNERLDQCRQECEQLRTRLRPINYSRALISRLYSKGRQWISNPHS
ncbi:methyltransferase domain-containing protein [Archangium violaceum]|uniref:class I SAM-dependent methyltransferase n=1 Tax=Archangium violaceum TaxID=83451 RepID=UPI00193B8216|nr:class I SAM-dependent methyltransferase [Archangium violaceum]QRK05460.1 methyltransferase domain-containing protein [Archangium violaceum]